MFIYLYFYTALKKIICEIFRLFGSQQIFGKSSDIGNVNLTGVLCLDGISLITIMRETIRKLSKALSIVSPIIFNTWLMYLYESYRNSVRTGEY